MDKVDRLIIKKRIIMYSSAVIILLWSAFLFNKWIEALYFALAHILIRYQFKWQLHFVETEMCILVTSCVIFFGILTVLPLNLSLYSSIPLAYFISFIGYILAENRFINNKLKKYNSKTDAEKFEDMFAKAHLSDRDTLLARMYYIERKTPKDIWLWLCCQKQYDQIEWTSVYQALWRIKKKLGDVEGL